jgi:5'-3' exonuclease
VADKIMFDNIKKKHNKIIVSSWNNNAITPGTEFMIKLNKKLLEWAASYPVNIIYSSCFTPAEGEHKLLQYIRTNQKNKIDMSYVIYGLDADLIFLALSTNSDKIYLLREANEINKNESYEVLNYVSINIMRKCIVDTITESLHKENEDSMNCDEIKLGGFKLNPDNVVNDFIFMCYFLGNDFLPHIPSLEICHNGIDTLITNYVSTMHKLLLENNKLVYLLENDINMDFLKLFMSNISYQEHTILNTNYNTKKHRMRCDSADPYELEMHKIDNLQFKINDPIKLGSDSFENYRARYYKYYWDVDLDELEEFSMKVASNYLMGIKWVTLYYFDTCPSWTWFYPFDHPPFITDIAKVLSNDNYNMNTIKFDMSKPIVPFMQLMAVLPPQSNYLIPNSLKKLLLDSRSQLAYMYPYEFKQDFINKHKYWMGTPSLPPLDLTLLTYVYNKYKDELTPEEKDRNKILDIYVFNK